MANDDDYGTYNLEMQDKWVMYKDREEWADLKPIKQLDGPNPVVKIPYSDDFVDVYDYFRGVVAVGEKSTRALKLTEDAIELNAANYSVWGYRRDILEHLDCNLSEELQFCREMIEANPKNYQVWHHRRTIAKEMGNVANELRLTEIIFSQDAKNYHAWEHRQWALKTFGISGDSELAFTSRLIADDVRNNSAWNHRHFVIQRSTGVTLPVLQRELCYAKQCVDKLHNNESPWLYIKGLLRSAKATNVEVAACWRDIEAWCWWLLQCSTVGTGHGASNGELPAGTDQATSCISDTGNSCSNDTGNSCSNDTGNSCSNDTGNSCSNDTGNSCSNDTSNTTDDSRNVTEDARSPEEIILANLTSSAKGTFSPHLLIGLLDCIINRLENLEQDQDKSKHLETAVKVCELLSSKHDTIRTRYWQYLGRQLTQQHSRGNNGGGSTEGPTSNGDVIGTTEADQRHSVPS